MFPQIPSLPRARMTTTTLVIATSSAVMGSTGAKYHQHHMIGQDWADCIEQSREWRSAEVPLGKIFSSRSCAGLTKSKRDDQDQERAYQELRA